VRRGAGRVATRGGSPSEVWATGRASSLALSSQRGGRIGGSPVFGDEPDLAIVPSFRAPRGSLSQPSPKRPCVRGRRHRVPTSRGRGHGRRDPRLAAGVAEGLRGERGVRPTSWLRGADHRPPRPWHTCSRRRAGPRGSVDRAARSSVKMSVRALMTLAPSCPTTTRSVPPDIAAGLPLLGLSKERPSIGKVGESTPGPASLPCLRGEATSLTRVPPSWFLTTSTVCSSSTPRACCIPLPILGFTAFPTVAKRPSPRCLSALRSFIPRR